MAREWDAVSYDSLELPHVDWGRRVLDRMVLTGSERVLDAGCGTGRDGAALLARWPQVHLVELDGSAQMLEVARQNVVGDAVEFVQADLTEPLSIAEPVDAVMSVAAFHWVEDHDLLFTNLAAVMRPGGRLTSDCGGAGNIAQVEAAIRQLTGAAKRGVEFSDVHETRESLERAGFDVERVALRPAPFRIEDPVVLEKYFATVILGGYLVELSDDDGTAFVKQVCQALSEPVVDYVRLEIDAVRR